MMRKNKETLRNLEGLGPKSEKCLNDIGIYTKADLIKIGAVKAFIQIQNESESMKPSLNFLYAMVGALEDRKWTDIAKNERYRLLMELDGYKELESKFKK
jgi:DNA transformation protein